MQDPEKLDTHPLRVLLVEDNPGDARLIRELLSESRDGTYQLECAETLREARARLVREEVDLVLLDLGLPDSSGLDTVIAVHAAAPEVPIVVLSGSDDEDLAVRSVRVEAQDYLVKGEVDPPRLQRALRQAIERRRRQKERSRALQLENEGLRLLNDRLRKLLDVDPLTEVLNRRGLERVLKSELGRMRRGESAAMACLVDCDDFKSVNDALGHDAGDAVLREIARRLSVCVRSFDHVGRIGGDEFLVLISHADADEAERVAQRLRRTVGDQPLACVEHDLRVTVSLGLAELSTDMVSLDDVMVATEVALQESKRNGKNRVSLAHSGRLPRDKWTRRNDVGRLLEKGNLLAVQLPILRTSDESEWGCELLSRGRVPGLEMPDVFFHAARQCDLLVQLDVCCLETCLSAASALRGRVSEHVFVNLHPLTLLRTPVEHLLKQFADSGLAGRVVVELSERGFDIEPAALREPLLALRRAGVAIALDDVGSGISPVECLVELEAEWIKIDSHFVREASRHPEAVDGLRRLADIGLALGAKLVAEGVETPEELEIVRSLGLTYAQGFLWGRPREVLAECPSPS